MELILWRHASANHYQDGKRILDPFGHQQALTSGSWLKQFYPNCTVWTSEAQRTQETARYYSAQFTQKSALNPEHDEETVFAEIQESGESSLIVVGHQMWIGGLAARLSGNNEWLLYAPSQVVVFALHNQKWRVINYFKP